MEVVTLITVSGVNGQGLVVDEVCQGSFSFPHI